MASLLAGADCSADAGGRDRGRQPAQKRADHGAAGDRPSSRQRSRPPQRRGERRASWRRCSTSPSCRRWPAFSTSRSFSTLVAPGRRMGLLGRSEDPRRARRSRHGARGARGPKARQRRPSFGSRFAIHLGRFRQSLQGGRRSKSATGSVGDAYDNGALREFLRHPRMRADRSAASDLTARRGWPSFNSSKASTIPHAATRPWAIFRPSNTKANIMA